MDKQEALVKIKELEEYIKSLDNPVGFGNDRVFLLSAEEYERYKEKIPLARCYWWLRSPGYGSFDVEVVHHDGSVYYYGFYVDSAYSGVRPALKYEGLKNITKSVYTSRFIWNEIRWVIIDEENKIAISEMPIYFYKFDDESNDYEVSTIRKYLLSWLKDYEL